MKKIGQPISITLTEEQRAWIDSKICPGGTRTEVIRRIIDHAFRKESPKLYKKSKLPKSAEVS